MCVFGKRSVFVCGFECFRGEVLVVFGSLETALRSVEGVVKYVVAEESVVVAAGGRGGDAVVGGGGEVRGRGGDACGRGVGDCA